MPKTPKTPPRECVNCGRIFQPFGGGAAQQVFCRRPDCRKASYAARKLSKQKFVMFRCECCQRIFRRFRGKEQWCKNPACQEDKAIVNADNQKASRIKYEKYKKFKSVKKEAEFRKNPRPKKREHDRKCRVCGEYCWPNWFNCKAHTPEEDWLDNYPGGMAVEWF